VTTDAGGRRESHPFTLTNSAGSTHRSILVRASGDWTTAAQHSLHPGDTLTTEGPFGAFLPGSSAGPELWIAGGAGITPFLYALRTAKSHGTVDHQPVHLIVCAQGAADAPCWDEIRTTAQSLPWLSVQSAFTADGTRLTPDALDALAVNAPRTATGTRAAPKGSSRRPKRRTTGPTAHPHISTPRPTVGADLVAQRMNPCSRPGPSVS